MLVCKQKKKLSTKKQVTIFNFAFFQSPIFESYFQRKLLLSTTENEKNKKIEHFCVWNRNILKTKIIAGKSILVIKDGFTNIFHLTPLSDIDRYSKLFRLPQEKIIILTRWVKKFWLATSVRNILWTSCTSVS